MRNWDLKRILCVDQLSMLNMAGMTPNLVGQHADTPYSKYN